MIQQVQYRSKLCTAVSILELIYHATVREVRKGHGNALMALTLNILQVLLFVATFYVLFVLLGLRGVALRGDFLLYIMSGIFLYMSHVKTLSAVVRAEGPTAPMMKHAPMTTAVSISAAALGALYIQVLSMVLILFAYHVGFQPFEIERPFPAFGMLLLAWFTGAAAGLVLLAIKPWFPTFVMTFTTIYQRANMIGSGKMFVANMLPTFMLMMFSWNPLFHAIDQARGFIFVNYSPYNTNVTYPIVVGVTLMMIGLMGEFYTRRRASFSWSARR